MGESKIEWTEHSWNPIRDSRGGTHCTKVSPGCLNCYASTMTRRFHGREYSYRPDLGYIPTIDERILREPSRRKKPTVYFVCSMTDLFHEQVTNKQVNDVWNLMFNNPRHTFLVLTKRPLRLQQWTELAARAKGWPINEIWPDWIWLGCTAENQEEADRRIPLLLATPCAKRFVSVEPMLGPVGLPAGLDWVICGGESGPKARSLNPNWVISLRDECVNGGVPFFFKQWGEYEYTFGGAAWYERKMGKKRAGRLLDGREWSERPARATGKE